MESDAISRKQKDHEHYIKYQEYYREYRKKYYQQNKELHNKRQADWYQRNKEKHLTSSRKWAANNLNKKALYRRTRRSKLSTALYTVEQLDDKMRYFGNKCVYCDGPFEEVDHAIPLDRGGKDFLANLVPSCRSCNRKKHTKTIWEFFRLKKNEHD